jgi:hypothetical protein
MKFCPTCGDKIADNFTFCPSCGTDLNQLKEDIGETHTIDKGAVKETGQGISIGESTSKVEGEVIKNKNGFLSDMGGPKKETRQGRLKLFFKIFGAIVLLLIMISIIAVFIAGYYSASGSQGIRKSVETSPSYLPPSSTTVPTPVTPVQIPTSASTSTPQQEGPICTVQTGTTGVYSYFQCPPGTVCGVGENAGKCVPVQSSTITQVSGDSTQLGRNIGIVKGIAQEYHRTHTFLGTQTGQSANIFVCVDMSKDVWDMIETQGIHAQIRIGNIDKDKPSISEADHAWVMAEVAPEQWLAVETTGGYVVYQTDNPRYYYGWTFNTPADLSKYSCGGTYCFTGTCLNGQCVSCNTGYIMGNDFKCHAECGSGIYCTGNSVCMNSQCLGCNPGYVLGNDLKCHTECGSGTYCTGYSICVNGQCRGCSPGYVLGNDLQCHPECGSGTYCGTGTCYNGQCVTCPAGKYLGTDGRCYSY